MSDVEAGGWSSWPAPAKLNLFLHVVGRRPDGYHDLQTVFRILDWGDTIHLRVGPAGPIRRIGPSAPGVEEAQDLVVRAAELLRSSANCPLSADIRVEKRIPTGGGFGGGSSDAATVLVALNALWGLHLPVEELAALGCKLGADVPVFIRGHNAWAEGVGERLTPLALAPAWYLLVDPGVHVPTPELFRAPDLTRDAAPAKIADFASGTLLDNAFEPVLRRREPAVEAVFQALARVGSPRLTGSGGGCFVEFDSLHAAERARSELPAELRAWVVGGAARSPLLDALAAMKV